MSLPTALVRRLRGLFRGGREDAETQEELRFHLEMETEKNLRAGMDPREARRQARLRLGGVDAIREAVREAHGARPVEALLRDLGYALRGARRNPGFTFAAVAALACGIGVSTTAFTIVNAVTRGLPVDEPDRIVRVGVLDASQRPARVSPRELEAWRSASTLAGIAAFSETMATVSERGRSPEPVAAAYVSADTFGLLGERPVLGREFLPEAGRPGAPVVALLGRCSVAQSLQRRSIDSRPLDHRR